MSKIPAKKGTPTKPVQPPKQNNELSTAGVDSSKKETVKYMKMKAVTPAEMGKLQDLTQWPIIMDPVGNLNTFYRLNELVIDFTIPPTAERVANLLQRAFFGLSFNPDGSIDDHRKYSIPDSVNRLVAVIMEEKDIGTCVEQLRRACTALHPDLFDTVFRKANAKDSGRDDLDRLFVITQTPDTIRQSDYYQFGAKNRSEVPFTCVWITNLAEVPSALDDLFGLRFKVNYD